MEERRSAEKKGRKEWIKIKKRKNKVCRKGRENKREGREIINVGKEGKKE